jgi:hypothetical protein
MAHLKQQNVCIKFYFKLGKISKEIFKLLKVSFAEQIMRNNTSFWVVFQAWKKCDTPLKMPIAWVVHQWVQQMKMWNWVKKLILKNIGITIQEVRNVLGISFWSVQSILKENLIMCQTAVKFMFCHVYSALSAPQFLAKNKKTVISHFPTHHIQHDVTSFSQNSRCHYREGDIMVSPWHKQNQGMPLPSFKYCTWWKAQTEVQSLEE